MLIEINPIDAHLHQVLSGDSAEPGCVSSREELLCRAAVSPQNVQDVAKSLLEEPSCEEVVGFEQQ